MEKPLYIAAIDLGTHKIVGAIAEKKDNGMIELLAVEKEMTRKGSIVKGKIMDVENVLFQINSICKKLHNQTKININRLHLYCSGLVSYANDEKWEILTNQLQQKKIEVIECKNALQREAEYATTDQEKEDGYLYINMGAGMTTFLLHKDGHEDIQDSIKIGGNTITSDLTYLNLSEEEAEKLKRKLGDAQPKNIANPGTIICLSKNDSMGNQRSISIGQLSQMIEERVQDWAQKLLIPLMQKKALERGKTHIVLTGGSVALKHLPEWLESYAGLPVRVATLSHWIEEDEDSAYFSGIAYSTLISLLVAGNTHCIKTGTSTFKKIKTMMVKNGNKIIDHGITELFPVDNQ